VTGDKLVLGLRRAAALLERERAGLDKINVFPVADGDTGTNMCAAISAALIAVEGLPAASPAGRVLSAAADAALGAARGNSGLLLALILKGFAAAAADDEELDAAALARALREGYGAAYAAVLKPMEGTILTVARAAALAAQREQERAGGQERILLAALAAAEGALEETTAQLPQLARAGVVDAGGQGYVYFLRGLADIPGGGSAEASAAETKGGESEGGFCVNFTLARGDSPALRGELAALGESVVLAESGGALKIHLHCNNPAAVLAKLAQLGAVSDIFVEET
jgi:dihydroxyacetone kinase-like predicted kinase